MTCDRPLVFVDLDDTLFQTARKMAEGTPRSVATRDVQGQPNGYMSPVQQAFTHWLLASADVVPVTARSVEAYRRVELGFSHGAVCAHGGVMLGADGSVDRHWCARMADALLPFQQRLPELVDAALGIGKGLGYSLRGWVVEERGQRHYVVIKHNETDDSVLARVLDEVRGWGLLAGMQVHRNGNNLAFLPEGLGKRLAVEEWLRRDRTACGERPVLGMGDSLTDLGFMGLCDWWATPSRSQLAKALEGALDD